MKPRPRVWPFVVSVVLVAAAAVAGATAYLLAGDTKVSVSGLLAMVAGIVLTFAVGAGLMFLVFLSARRGHDDDVG